jgi:hypothetical protein
MSDADLIRERDRAVKRAETLEAEVWALGVQVVAQKARLRLAEVIVDGARYGQPTLAMRLALAAWDNVPGQEP